MGNDLQGDILSAEDHVNCISKKYDIGLVGNVHCTSCHKTVVHTSDCTFNCDNYDFSEYIVSCALSCKHRLKEVSMNSFVKLVINV